MKRINLTLSVLACTLALSACGGAKEKLGLAKQAPDEFAVVKRAPLAMPPDYTLRPPSPGAPRPQETATDTQAREAIFGLATAAATNPDSAEESLLTAAGGDRALPGIRDIVNRETEALQPKEKPVAERLLGFTGLGGKDQPPATVVDARAESERLKTNAAEGKSVTDGETPSLDN